MTNKVDFPKPPKEMLDYYTKLNKYIKKQTNNLKMITINMIDDNNQFVKNIKKDTSLLENGFINIDAKQVANNFKKLVELLQEVSVDNELIEPLNSIVEENLLEDEFWSNSIEKIEEEIVKLANQNNIDAYSLLQLAYWAMSPYWRLTVNQYKDALSDFGTNERGTCLICGKHANFALLDDGEHGRRYLVCLHCDFKWPFKRIGCSYCGNDEFEKLGYIVVDNVEGYKIYHCEKCKTYLKTFDERADVPRLSDNMIMENIETLFLDVLAAEKGYQKMS